jgi:hypothetical protein
MSENSPHNPEPRRKKGERSAPAEIELSDLVAYLDGELDAPVVDIIEKKLLADPPLRLSAEKLDKTWQLLETLEETEASGEFTMRTLASVSAVSSEAVHTSGSRQLDSPADHRAAGHTGNQLRTVWKQPAQLLLLSAVFSTVGLSVQQWYSESQRPASEVEIFQKLDLLRGLPQYRLLPNVEFLRTLKISTPAVSGSGSSVTSDSARQEKSQ